METEETVIQKMTSFVDTKFNGHWNEAFNHYANDTNMSRDELIEVLVKAEIGSRFTRKTIANRIMEKMDADNDGFITFAEFEKIRDR